MIEELHALVEMLGQLPDAALWGAGIFFGYKLILYGGTTGALVYSLKLLIGAVLRFKSTPKQPLPPADFTLDDICIDSSINLRLRRAIKSLTGTSFMHDSNVDWLEDAIVEHRKINPQYWEKKNYG